MLWDTAESFTVKVFRTSIYDEVTPLGLMKSNSTEIIAPLKQINLGLESYDVMCNSNLLLIQKYDGSPACVKEQTILRLINRGWTADVQTSFEILNSESEIISCSINSKEITPGPYPLQSCPVMSHRIEGIVLNNTGFSSISDSGLFVNADNFVLKPGNNGIITFLYELEYVDVPSNFKTLPPQEVNMTNYVQFVHYKTLNLEDLENYPDTILKKDHNSFATCFNAPNGNSCVGEITNNYRVNAFVYDHPGIDVYFDKPFEIISASESAVSTIPVSVDKDALQGTYLVKLPNGVCSGGLIFLLWIIVVMKMKTRTSIITIIILSAHFNSAYADMGLEGAMFLLLLYIIFFIGASVLFTKGIFWASYKIKEIEKSGKNNPLLIKYKFVYATMIISAGIVVAGILLSLTVTL